MERCKPIFLFSPKNLLKTPSGDRFYISYALSSGRKNKEIFSFNYLIGDQYIDEKGNISPKFITNSEQYDSLDKLYYRFYNFVEQFGPDHPKENDLKFILDQNPTLESLQKRFIDYATERSEIYTKQFILENAEEISEKLRKSAQTVENQDDKNFLGKIKKRLTGKKK